MQTPYKPEMNQLFTNADGRISNTGSLQIVGFIVLAIVILYSVYLDRAYVPELCWTFAFYCGTPPISKGVVNAWRARKETKEQA